MRKLLAACFLLVLASPPAFALRFERVASRAGEPGFGYVLQPLRGGRFVLAWGRWTTGGLGAEVSTEVFAADGTLEGSLDRCIEDSGGLKTRSPSLLGLPDGTFVLGCEMFGPRTLSITTLQRYGPDLAPLGPRYRSDDANLALAEVTGMTVADARSYMATFVQCSPESCGEVHHRFDFDGHELGRFSVPGAVETRLFQVAPKRFLTVERRSLGAYPYTPDDRAIVTTARGKPKSDPAPLTGIPGASFWTTRVLTNLFGRSAILQLSWMPGFSGAGFHVRTFAGAALDDSVVVTARLPHRARRWGDGWAIPLESGFLLVGSPPLFVQQYREDGTPLSNHVSGPSDAAGVIQVVPDSTEGSFLMLIQRGEPGEYATEVWRLSL